MKMPVPCGRDKVLSSAVSWSLPKRISAHVGLLLKILLWLPSSLRVKAEVLGLSHFQGLCTHCFLYRECSSLREPCIFLLLYFLINIVYNIMIVE